MGTTCSPRIRRTGTNESGNSDLTMPSCDVADNNLGECKRGIVYVRGPYTWMLNGSCLMLHLCIVQRADLVGVYIINWRPVTCT